MGKLDLRSIFNSYLSTLRDNRNNSPSFVDRLIHICIPALCAISVFVLDVFNIIDLTSYEGISSDLVTGISIVASLMFGLAALVFDLRIQLANQEKPSPTGDEVILIDELFYDIMWGIVDGFSVVALILIAKSSPFPDLMQIAAGSMGAGFLLNFIFVTCMCMKRLHAAYKIVSGQW